MRFLLIALVALMLPLVSHGYTQSTYASFSGGKTFTLCDAETGTSVCDDADGVDIAATVLGYDLLTFSHSGTGAYSCTFYGGDQSVTNAGATDLSTSGYVLGSISSSSSAFVYSDANFAAVWAVCSTNPTNVTIRVQGVRR